MIIFVRSIVRIRVASCIWGGFGQDWLGLQSITEGIVCIMVVGITGVIWVLLRKVGGVLCGRWRGLFGG